MTLHRAHRNRALLLATAFLFVIGIAATGTPARAQDATWLANPGSSDFDTAGNWTSVTTVPTGTASFGTSSTTSLTFSSPTTNIGGWTFNPGASVYTFTNANTLTFSGAGIVNGGSAAIANNGYLNFQNSSTAGSAAITNNNGGYINFLNNSTAGSATFTNAYIINFDNASTAGSATINNNNTLAFYNTATAGGSTIVNNDYLQFFDSSSAGSSALTNNHNTSFFATSTAGTANITNTSVLAFYQTSTAGSAAITNNSGGTVDFSGTTGPAGNNQVSAGSIAGAGNFYLGANQLTVGSNNLSTTVSGVISDCGTGGTACSYPGTGGSLVKVGTSTLTLSGTNTYSGGTTINGGTLAVSSDANLGAASGGLTFNGGTLQSGVNFFSSRSITLNAGGGTFDTQANSGTLAGDISGSGGLTKLGTGELDLLGSNTYSGPTNVNSGYLIAEGGGAAFSAASAFNVAAGATLDLNGLSQTIGSLSGAGTVTNSFLGRPATLTTGADNTSTTFSGTISDFVGRISLTKIGTGTLALTGTNTYSGATTVNGGTLEVDGSIAHSLSVTVNSGATLSGTGIVDSVTAIMSGGTLAPGNASNPTGTLTITGNLAFQSGALYVVQVAQSSAASTTVSGSATLTGATVNAQFAPGYVTKQYTILTATGGLGGTSFAGLTNANLPAGFADSLSYSGNSVILNLAAALGAGGGLNRNQQNVANTLNTFFNNGGALPPNFAGIFGLTGSSLANALTQASGESATGSQQATFDAMNLFMGVLTDPFIAGRGDGAASGAGAPTGYASTQTTGATRDAYAMFTKAPPAAFRAALERMGGGLWRLADHRRQCRARLQQHDQQYRRHRRRRRLSHLAKYDRRLCAGRRRHQFQRRG